MIRELPTVEHTADLADLDDGPHRQLELFEATQITRPDLNMGKWAGWLFSSPWARDLHEPKTHVWTVKDDEKQRKASISVIPAKGRKRPTVTSQRVFLALIQVWEQMGMPPDGRVSFSARQIAYLLNWKWAGRKTAERIQEHLSILSSTTINWERSFVEGKEIQRLKEEMKIIDSKAYLTREKMEDQEFFRGQHSVRLSQEMVDNMISGVTKPINFHSFRAIENTTDAKLYSLLDTFLSEKTIWKRRAHGLIRNELEFDGERYESRRTRLAFLKERIKNLSGVELSNGVLRLDYETTADKADYNLVARREPHKTKKRRQPSKPANPEEDIPFIVEDLIDGLEQIGSVPASSRKTLEILPRWYSRSMLFDRLAVLKADYRESVKTNPAAAYMYIVHVEAHLRGLDWIKDCGKDCPYRDMERAGGWKKE